ncbi:MAG TPA: hypothetical protein VGG73_08970 [Vicinamibacterales bacterium]
MRNKPLLTALVLAVVSAPMVGCGILDKLTSDSSNSTSTSTSTTATSGGSSFSGTLGVGGSSVVTFSVASAGAVTLTLSAMSSVPPGGVGLGIGTPTGVSGCSLATFTTSALPSTTAQIAVNEPVGTYCAQIYDTGSMTVSSAFTVAIIHP